MSKHLIALVFLVGFALFYSSVCSQSDRRSYTASNFRLELDGPGKGFLRPVRQGDTLVYTIDKLADSVMIRKKFDSTFHTAGKRYYLKFKPKKRVTVSGNK